MLQTIVSYAVTAALGWFAKVIHNAWIAYQAKQKANAANTQAIQNAENNDDTSGLFGGGGV